ncbi:NUDIX hydrolase [Buchananella hordeovulneris]|uniref:NUDIX hydrolase n=1 Tax=Buchananella hordeovulneris TaxID=52770 RepID=UPI001FEF45D0|nr:NUDIX domain-containing protein [Buchananella hordeovulneris]
MVASPHHPAGASEQAAPAGRFTEPAAEGQPPAGDCLAARLQRQQLSAEWVPDADGVPSRRAARVVVFDEDGRVLLARGHDAMRPERTWWFTIGGGIEVGESPRAAAARELREEVGIVVPPVHLVGPVLTRSSEFVFATITVRQDEVFYLYHLSSSAPRQAANWTELERQVVDEVAWLSVAQLRASSHACYPRQLPDLLEVWQAGWDGSCPHVVELGQ